MPTSKNYWNAFMQKYWDNKNWIRLIIQTWRSFAIFFLASDIRNWMSASRKTCWNLLIRSGLRRTGRPLAGIFHVSLSKDTPIGGDESRWFIWRLWKTYCVNNLTPQGQLTLQGTIGVWTDVKVLWAKSDDGEAEM